MIRETVASVDPAQPVYDVRGMFARVQETWANSRFMSFLLVTFSGTGIDAFDGWVVWRSGVQRCSDGCAKSVCVSRLGASRSHIYALILGQGARLLAFGLVIGLGGAIACFTGAREFSL